MWFGEAIDCGLRGGLTSSFCDCVELISMDVDGSSIPHAAYSRGEGRVADLGRGGRWVRNVGARGRK